MQCGRKSQWVDPEGDPESACVRLAVPRAAGEGALIEWMWLGCTMSAGEPHAWHLLLGRENLLLRKDDGETTQFSRPL